MTKHRKVNEFYSSLLGNHAVTLDPRWQRHIVEYANRTRKYNLHVGLLKRPDVTDDIVAELANHSAAAVKAAWLARHVDDIDVVTAAIAGETRGAVLAAVIAEERLPDELFNRIAADAANVELIVAAIGTGRATEAVVYELLSRVASRPTMASDRVIRQLAEQREKYPALFDALLTHTRSVEVAAAALQRCSDGVTDTEKVDATHRVLGVLLEKNPTVDHRQIGPAIHLLSVLVANTAALDEVSVTVRHFADQLRIRTAGGYLAGQLDDLVERLFDDFDEIAATLDGTDGAAVAALSEARRLASRRAGQVKHPWQNRVAPGQRRLYARVVCDTTYSDEVRETAVSDLSEQFNGSIQWLHAPLEARRPRLTVDMAVKLHNKGLHWNLDLLLDLVEDRDRFIDRLITSTRDAHLGSQLLIQLDTLGELTDDRVAAAAELAPVSWFAELPIDHPAIRRVVETGLSITVDELGSDGDGWEFFEACFGTVAANPAVLAKLSSTAE